MTVSCASTATVVPLGDAAQRNTCADQADLKETDWRFFPQPSGTRNFFYQMIGNPILGSGFSGANFEKSFW
jgi:hypothetical protein